MYAGALFLNCLISTAKFMACVEPAYWSLILPLRVQKNWNASLIGHKYSWWKSTWEYMYMNKTNAAKDFPADDLEFTLSKGFKVSIPRGELFGGAVVINSTRGGFDPIEGQDGMWLRDMRGGSENTQLRLLICRRPASDTGELWHGRIQRRHGAQNAFAGRAIPKPGLRCRRL